MSDNGTMASGFHNPSNLDSPADATNGTPKSGRRNSEISTKKPANAPDSNVMTFWEHLDVLRESILQSLAMALLATVVAFCFKEPLFRWLLAPTKNEFFLWQVLGSEPFSMQLINTQLTEQFMVHVKVAVMVGLLLASPAWLAIAFRFIAPALYANERRWAWRVGIAAYFMFLLGVVANYCLVFPLSVRFLATYQVSADVANMLTLSSYFDTLLMLSLALGIVFETPVVAWLLAHFGLLRAEWMAHYRRHALVVILVAAAVITPTADALTLLIVSVPMWLLYEASILIVRITNANSIKNE